MLPLGVAWPLAVALLILSSIALFVYQLATLHSGKPTPPPTPSRRSKMRRTRKGKHSRRSSIVPLGIPSPTKVPPPTPIVIAPLNATTLYHALRQHDKTPEPSHHREIPLETPPESVIDSSDGLEVEVDADSEEPPPTVGAPHYIIPLSHQPLKYFLIRNNHSMHS